jgi:hypothetical protein
MVSVGRLALRRRPVQARSRLVARIHLSARKSRSAELVWLMQEDELVRLAQNHVPPWTSSAQHDEAEEPVQDQPPSLGAQ